ncbi:MAG: cobyric acid synthase [Thermodesulfobacteriota bacterium]|nr:cobyric acid synthase [Thermodesulfobacteriota bacterium]
MKKIAKSIMFLGTGSDVGKSVITTAFCRILKQRGVRVAPFKAQNMSNNAYVTLEGGEIGRAQAVQAEAAGLLPSVHMNPVLLKPVSDRGVQVVVQGRVVDTLSGRAYYESRDQVQSRIMESFSILKAGYEAILMEGAGSCCEVNLRPRDVVNFEMALATGSPVVLVADIDRGGVFAQIIGTMELISPKERDLVAGFIINKFRGDPDLFAGGISFIEQRTGRPVLGLAPYFKDIHIDMEDSMSLDETLARTGPVKGKINIAVVKVPHVANFTDIHALEQEPETNIVWLSSPADLAPYQAVILPGSKSVIADMTVLHEQGWPRALSRYLEAGQGRVVGLCGGYQMLGRTIEDPEGVEGASPHATGFGLLDITTRIEAVKQVRLSSGRDRLFGAKVHGYEIHMGNTRMGEQALPFIDFDHQPDGAVSVDGRVMGTYLHGLFDSGVFRGRFLAALAKAGHIPFDPSGLREDYDQVRQRNYDLLAEHVKRHVEVDRILALMGI